LQGRFLDEQGNRRARTYTDTSETVSIALALNGPVFG
jgi:hypothetical protein